MVDGDYGVLDSETTPVGGLGVLCIHEIYVGDDIVRIRRVLDPHPAPFRCGLRKSGICGVRLQGKSGHPAQRNVLIGVALDICFAENIDPFVFIDEDAHSRLNGERRSYGDGYIGCDAKRARGQRPHNVGRVAAAGTGAKWQRAHVGA